MNLKPVEIDNYKIYAVEDSPGKCHLLDFLANIPSNQKSSRNQLLIIFKQAAQNGPQKLSQERCHEADGQNKIFEFIANNLRVLWFYDDGKLVICTHVFVKKSPSTPQAEKKRAIALKKLYFENKKQNKLTFLIE